ncbi:T9SS type A sorting domain-containing protein [uncultured Microscilla sp.]|uniref:T9SS type A sorting domain-containing protein n=1 Tax=uncultured Microscilla sp. TaxID=432653 RepID=UPI00261A7D51|nr:T9SS type A sorting domain-containing protein [uncultured Microscilla sp.]
MKFTITTFRHFIILFLLSVGIQFVAQAQLVGNITVTNSGIGASESYTIVFNGENKLPGVSKGHFYPDPLVQDGGCEYTAEVTTLSDYDAGVLHSQTVIPLNTNGCSNRGFAFRWMPQLMYVPTIPNNSVCSGSSFTLSLPIQTNDKIEQYHWQQSTDGGATWTDAANTSGTAYTTTPSLVINAPKVASPQNMLYRARGFRYGKLVAPFGGALPIYLFSAAPDPFSGVAYSDNQSNGWQLEDRIPLKLGTTTIGEVIVRHLTCSNGLNASIRVKFNNPYNPTNNYYYSLAEGDYTNDFLYPIPSNPTDLIFSDILDSGSFPISVENRGNPGIDEVFSGKGKGSYTLAIENKDASGARYCFNKYLIKIKSPSPVTLTEQTAQRSNPSCIGAADGQIVLTAGGGAAAQSGTYKYTILKYRNGALVETRPNLSPGNHTFGGLDAANYHFEIRESGCGATTLVTLPNPGAITLSNPSTTVATSAVASPIVCEGGTGSIAVSFTQGNESGTYTIEAYKDGTSTAHATANGITYVSGGHTFTGLPAGSYTFKLKHSCSSGGNYDITTPQILTDLVPVVGTLAGIPQTGSTHAISCKGGSDGRLGVKVTTGNAIAPNTAYTLVLKQGGTVVNTPTFVGFGTTSLSGVTVGDSVVFTGLAEANYSVEISQNNCPQPAKVLGNVTLTAPATLTATITPVLRFATYHVTCANGEDGQIRVDNVTGGNGNYTIELNENGAKIATQMGTSALFTGLRPTNFQGGTVVYSIRVVDDKTCEYMSLPIQLQASPVLTASLITERVTCKGESNGSIAATIGGGVKPYTIQWLDGANSPITAEITLGATESTATLSNRPAGAYKLRVKDAQGCHNFVTGGWFETSTTIDESAVAFAFEVASFTIDSVSCHGGSDGRVTLAVVGGWGGYAYSKDGTNFQASAVFSGFAAGDHTLYARDAENCTISTTVRIKEPLLLMLAQQQITHVSCKGGYNGTYIFEATGGNDAGTQPYTILVNGAPYAETDWYTWTTNRQISLRGLAAASYTIEATDHKGCQQTLSFTITEPAQLLATIGNITTATCGLPNGSATVVATGGTTPYSYTWKKYEEVLGTLKTWSTSAQLTNAEGGAYEMIVTDALGCSVTEVVQLSNADAATVTNQNITQATCAEAKDGTATFSVEGAFPIQVSWVNSNETGQIAWQNAITLKLSGLAKGYHDFQTQDAKGCIRFERVLVPGPEPLLITRQMSQDPTCHNSTNGGLAVAISGGTAPYTIQWDNGLADGATSFDNLSAGTYTVAVTDAKGCTRQASFILQNPLPISVDLGVGSTVCVGQSVTLKPTIPAGNTIATYAWTSASGNFSSSASEVTVNTADTYFLTVTTAAGCSGSGQYKLANSASAFEADFLMPSDAVVGDTVVLIEICRPAPTTLFWDIEGLDQDVFLLESTVTNPKQHLLVPKEGTYTVRLYASLGGCQDVFERQVTVVKAEDKRLAQSGKAGQQITAQVSPNPVTGGKVNIAVSLAQAAPVSVEIFNISSGNRWRYPHPIQGSGKTDYHWSLHIPEMTQGVYVVRVQTPTEQKMLKVVVK